MLTFGMVTLCQGETVEEFARDYGNNPIAIVQYLNKTVPATSTNCMDVSKLVYAIMRKYQYSNLNLIGVWRRAEVGHAFVTFTDRWGDCYVITTARVDGVYQTIMIEVDTIEEYCNTWDKDWTHYFQYINNMRVLNRRTIR
jgi:hypothetical protein